MEQFTEDFLRFAFHHQEEADALQIRIEGAGNMMDLISYQIVSINTKKNKRKVLAEVLDKEQARAIAMRYGRSKKDDNVKIVMQEYRRSESDKGR